MKRGVLSGVLLIMLVGASGWAKGGRRVPSSGVKSKSTKVVGAKKPPKKIQNFLVKRLSCLGEQR